MIELTINVIYAVTRFDKKTEQKPRLCSPVNLVNHLHADITHHTKTYRRCNL